MYSEFDIFGIEVKVYAFFLMVALIIGSLILKYNIKRLNGANYEYLILSALVLTVGILGSQFFATYEGFFFNKSFLYSNLFSKSVLSHGKNFLGGLVLFFPFLFLYSKFSNLNFTSLLSVCCISVCIGYSIGRIGCLISGDGCYGIPTDLPWGMSFEHGLAPTFRKVHPTSLYEAVFSLFLFLYLEKLFLTSFQFKQNLKIIFMFFILFGFQRFLIEFIRLNKVYFIFTQAQWLSIVMIFIGLVILFQYKRTGDLK